MKLFKKKPQAERLYKHVFHVYRDWLFIVAFTVVIASASILYHAYRIYLITNEPDSAVLATSTPAIVTVNRQDLQNALASYTAMQAQFQAKQGQTPDIVDPSF